MFHIAKLEKDLQGTVKRRGNNRTKSALVGKAGVVKKSNGLGGWHLVVSVTVCPLCLNIGS